MLKIGFVTYILASALVLAPEASGETCETQGTVKVCHQSEGASISVAPQPVSQGVQNGPYGPSGNLPPLGDN